MRTDHWQATANLYARQSAPTHEPWPIHLVYFGPLVFYQRQFYSVPGRDEAKDLVWEKGKNDLLRGTDAKDMMLWEAGTERLADSSQQADFLLVAQSTGTHTTAGSCSTHLVNRRLIAT
jgi:hypothetical protein